jgi:hypothetical protein
MDSRAVNDWCMAILDYMESSVGEGDVIIQQFKSIVAKTSRMSALKMLKRDLSEWAGSMPEDDVQKLNALLTEKFGEDLSGNISEAAQVVSSGAIKDDDAFRLVQGRVDEILAKEGSEDEVAKLNERLADYEKKR